MNDIFRRALRAWGLSGVQYSRFYRTMEAFGPRLGSEHPLLAYLPTGDRVECDIRDHVQRHIYFQGVYEPIEAYLFSQLASPGNVVIDAGANIGQYTLLASAAVGPTGTVHAFEPVPQNFVRLQKNISINGKTNVRLNRNALWHATADLQFGLPAGDGPNDGSYSAGAVADSIAPVVSASAVRFDDYARDNGVNRVDLVKMDIEGAELSALLGMAEVLQRDRPTILMEVNRSACFSLGYDPQDLWEFLVLRLGYTAWQIGHSATSWRPVPDPANISQANVLFSPAELPNSVAGGWSFARCLRWANSGFLRRSGTG